MAQLNIPGSSPDSFQKSHMEVLCATDFFTTEVWTTRGLTTFYVLFVIHLGSRRVHLAGITEHPNDAWMAQVARNLTFEDDGFLKQNGCKYFIHDGDKKFTPHFLKILKDSGIKTSKTPFRSPNLNAFAERFVRTIKEECLDHFIPFGENFVWHTIKQFLEHYHEERCHQGKGKDNKLLFPSGKIPADQSAGRGVHVRRKTRLGGLLSFYYRRVS